MILVDRKNDTISFIRVIAMMSIVIGHICTWNNIPTYQLGAIGVEVFLFISGYLYGNKKIENRRKWLINRGCRILIPFWILAAFLSLVMLIKGDVINGIKQIFCAALNLQGFRYLLPGFDVKLHFIGGIGHCWFVTMIMFCYVLTALIKGSRIERRIDCRLGLAIGLAITLQIVLAYLGIQISYIIQFFVGYFYRRSEDKCEQRIMDYLGGNATLHEVVLKTSTPNLFFMDNNHHMAVNTRLDAMDAFDAFIADAKQYFDLIIFDTPPLGMFIDAASLAAKSDGVIVIVADGRIERKSLEKVFEQLKQVNAKLLGIAFNFVHHKEKSTYYNKYYRYGEQHKAERRQTGKALENEEKNS